MILTCIVATRQQHNLSFLAMTVITLPYLGKRCLHDLYTFSCNTDELSIFRNYLTKFGVNISGSTKGKMVFIISMNQSTPNLQGSSYMGFIYNPFLLRITFISTTITRYVNKIHVIHNGLAVFSI
jgi:hypothetical protein